MICASYAKGARNVKTLIDVTCMIDAEGIRRPFENPYGKFVPRGSHEGRSNE